MHKCVAKPGLFNPRWHVCIASIISFLSSFPCIFLYFFLLRGALQATPLFWPWPCCLSHQVLLHNGEFRNCCIKKQCLHFVVHYSTTSQVTSWMMTKNVIVSFVIILWPQIHLKFWHVRVHLKLCSSIVNILHLELYGSLSYLRK